MWHYQKFTKVIDGVSYEMYTTRGAEKLVGALTKIQQDTCVFMFGVIVVLRIEYGRGYSTMVRDVRSKKYTREINPSPEEGRCYVCGEQPSHIFLVDKRAMYPGANKYDSALRVCYTCWHDALTLDSTSRATTQPKMVSADCVMCIRKDNIIVAYYLYRDRMFEEDCLQHPDEYDECECYPPNPVNCMCHHTCDYKDTGYYDLSCRAAHMKWMCDRVLERYLLGTGIIPTIMMYVLSGIDCKWNR